MNVNEMSAEQVRREIAERVGYKDIFVDPNEAEWWTAILDHEAVPVPDWPHDTGAALALCLEIAQFEYTLRLEHGHHADGHVLVCVAFYEWDDNTDGHVDALVATGDTPALALSRLALLALRQEANGG